MNKWDKALQDFKGCSDRLEEAVSHLTDKQLDRVPEDGGWSPRQIIHHLADGACIWGMFIHQALAGKGGEFKLHWYWDISQEEWSDIWHYSSRDIGPSLEIYRSHQERLIPLLEKIDHPDELGLEFNIEGQEPSSITILEAIRFQPLHLREHLAEINKILHQG